MTKHHNGGEQRDFKSRWTHSGNKFVIGTIHGTPIEIVAQYNPKELARQATATWTPHPNTSAKYATNGESNMWSEYGTTAPRTLTVELLFDGYEEGLPIASVVEDLERLTIPVDMKSRDISKRRPQLCVAVWGKQQMRCVVQSVATKLTMFDAAGAPLRATCTVTLMEVDVVAMLKSDGQAGIARVAAKTGNAVATTPGHNWPYPPEDSKPTKVPAPNRSQPAPAPAAKPAPAPAPAAAPATPPPANTIGTPSAKINPAALDGGDAPLFADPAPTSANAVGTPSANVDPNSMDGKSDVFGEPPKPDATSGADAGTADPKYKAAAEDME